MTRYRYLETGAGNAAFNMGLDEAILESVATGAQPPTLRLYQWQPAAVSIGYFQGVRDEVDLDACSRLGVDVVRRLTGGGAVFHAAELTYSIVVPETDPLVRGTVIDSYRTICDGLIAGFGNLGIPAEFAPLNDILSGGKKVSGNAQTRKRGCLLQHGTVLLGVDVDTMFSLLRVPNEKLKGKLIEDVKARVTSTSALLGRTVTYEEAVPAFSAGFATILGNLGTPSQPDADELYRARVHALERFASESWLFKR
mgnify:CR=1 FL=1